ncbi:MAG TPA: transposase, partial [Candidatus Methylomirabilis sp.]|nr:transposase [Candidatus Methylomirabilis sp.]
HCASCQQDLRPIGEESSERYEYIPAQLTVIEDVCKKYACACTVKTATKPPQPIEKSTAGASLLAQVSVAKTVDHLPLNRQEKIFERHGVEISRKTMCGWMAQCADLLNPLYVSLKEVLFQSKVIGTDDTGVKVLDIKLPFARTGCIWPALWQNLWARRPCGRPLGFAWGVAALQWTSSRQLLSGSPVG